MTAIAKSCFTLDFIEQQAYVQRTLNLNGKFSHPTCPTLLQTVLRFLSFVVVLKL